MADAHDATQTVDAIAGTKNPPRPQTQTMAGTGDHLPLQQTTAMTSLANAMPSMQVVDSIRLQGAFAK